jgi:hypothetical protein
MNGPAHRIPVIAHIVGAALRYQSGIACSNVLDKSSIHGWCYPLGQRAGGWHTSHAAHPESSVNVTGRPLTTIPESRMLDV